jgi:type I restriction enzyme R subunit
MNEADTCRKYVVPKLQAAGWDADLHCIAEQRTFTDERIVVTGSEPRRLAGKRADYLLRYTRDVPIAVVEAKPGYKSAGDGMQQAKDYAEILGLKFAYATNGESILEFGYLTGIERTVDTFPSPDDLWARLRGAAHTSPNDLRRAFASWLKQRRRQQHGRREDDGAHDVAHGGARLRPHERRHLPRRHGQDARPAGSPGGP